MAESEEMFEFIPYEDHLDADALVGLIGRFQTKIYAKHVGGWDIYVLSNVPITPSKVMQWWNKDLSPNDEDYMFAPPNLTDVRPY